MTMDIFQMSFLLQMIHLSPLMVQMLMMQVMEYITLWYCPIMR